jgi:hypothetical protein
MIIGLLLQLTLVSKPTTVYRALRESSPLSNQPEENRTLRTAECRDKNGGGIEPMGKIFLLTFPFIGRAAFSLLVACRRDNVTADAAGRIGIFPLNLPELLHDAADSG